MSLKLASLKQPTKERIRINARAFVPPARDCRAEPEPIPEPEPVIDAAAAHAVVRVIRAHPRVTIRDIQDVVAGSTERRGKCSALRKRTGGARPVPVHRRFLETMTGKTYP